MAAEHHIPPGASALATLCAGLALILPGCAGTAAHTSATAPPPAASTDAHAPQASTTHGSGDAHTPATIFGRCLHRQGVSVPRRPGTARRSPSQRGAYRRAVQACEAQLRASGQIPPAAAAGARPPTATVPAARPRPTAAKAPPRLLAILKRFTACMRAHAVPGFPEPEGAAFNITRAHLNPATPAYKAAETACNPVLAPADQAR